MFGQYSPSSSSCQSKIEKYQNTPEEDEETIWKRRRPMPKSKLKATDTWDYPLDCGSENVETVYLPGVNLDAVGKRLSEKHDEAICPHRLTVLRCSCGSPTVYRCSICNLFLELDVGKTKSHVHTAKCEKAETSSFNGRKSVFDGVEDYPTEIIQGLLNDPQIEKEQNASQREKNVPRSKAKKKKRRGNASGLKMRSKQAPVVDDIVENFSDAMDISSSRSGKNMRRKKFQNRWGTDSYQSTSSEESRSSQAKIFSRSKGLKPGSSLLEKPAVTARKNMGVDKSIPNQKSANVANNNNGVLPIRRGASLLREGPRSQHFSLNPMLDSSVARTPGPRAAAPPSGSQRQRQNHRKDEYVRFPIFRN